MGEVYLAILAANLAIGGIAFGVAAVLRQAVASAAGDEVAAMLGRDRAIRVATLWLSTNAVLSLLAAIAVDARHDLVPLMSTGLDWWLGIVWVALLFLASSVGAIALAAWGLVRVARFLRPPEGVRILLTEWDEAILSDSGLRPQAVAVMDAGIRALLETRLEDYRRILGYVSARCLVLLTAESATTRSTFLTALRDRYLVPLAEEAIRLARPDQAAQVSALGRQLLALPGLDRGSRTALLGLSERILDLLQDDPRAARAVCSLVGDVEAAALSALDAKDGAMFDDCCYSLIPVAERAPSVFLDRDHPVPLENVEDWDRPVQRLAAALETTRRAAWDAFETEINPRAWSRVAETAASALVQWLNKVGRQNWGAEMVLVGMLQSVERLGLDEARRGGGDETGWALDALETVARAAEKVHFHELPGDVSELITHIGLEAESHNLASSSGSVAEEAAAILKRSLPGRLDGLRREVMIAGRFSHISEPIREAFVGRLRI